MRLTKEQFNRCFLYAAAGTDLQPLLRFTHLADTFVYVTTGEDPAVVDRSLRNKLENLSWVYPGALKLESGPAPFPEADCDAGPVGDWRQYLSAGEMRGYQAAFGAPARAGGWGAEYRLRRFFGTEPRTIRLVYIQGEALATYAALSHHGQYPPAIFCAIQSGELERLGGLADRMFWLHPKRPRLFVRGYWDNNWQPRHPVPLPAQAPVREGGGFINRVQTYPRWNSRMASLVIPRGRGGENSRGHYSAVSAFAEGSLGLPAVATLPNAPGPVRILNRPLTPADAVDYEAVFAYQGMFNHFKRHWPGPAGARLQLLRSSRSSPPKDLDLGPRVLLLEALRQIGRFCASTGAERVAMIPTGFEDEGALLLEGDWARTSLSLDVFAPEPMDLADLRGWGRDQSAAETPAPRYEAGSFHDNRSNLRQEIA